MENSGKKYKSIMSFGCMCSTAIFLRKYGFRSESTIFDWLSSSLQSNLKMLDDDFKHLLEKEYLTQPYKEFPHIVDNSFYNVSLNHMFDEYRSFEGQIRDVQKYCSRRINRFKSNLSNGDVLLVYYSRDKDECDWISFNEEKIRDYCLKYNFDIIFITNFDLPANFGFKHFLIPINNIHKPYGGGVSFPFEGADRIVEYLTDRFDEIKIKRNLKHRPNKHLLKRIIHHFNKKNGIKLKIS